MSWDTSEFPVVKLSFDDHHSQAEEEEAFSVFEALLDRETPFVIIGVSGSNDEHDHEHDPAERKRIVLWNKRNKPRLRSYVKAMIYVEPSTAKRLGMKAIQPVSEKFWGYPLLTAGSEAEALDKARALLIASSGSG